MSGVALADGAVVREQSRPKVYLLQDATKVWIPNPDALATMGFNWGMVQVVPDGALAGYEERAFSEQQPTDPSWPRTPGSIVYPPLNIQDPPGRHYAVPANTTWRVTSQGREVRIVSLQGWLYPYGGATTNDEAEWSDWHYAFEVDSRWASDAGIDLNEIVLVGNLIEDGIQKGGPPDRYACAALPLIDLEINGWKPGNTRNVPCPRDWTFPDGSAAGQDFLANDPSGSQLPFTKWPWDPRVPLGGGPTDEAAAVYARVVGSLVTDKPHAGGSSSAWEAGRNRGARDNPARRTEIHPPDSIEILPSQARRETLRGVAIVAGNGLFDAGSTTLTTTIPPPGARPSPTHRVGFIELVGPETNAGTVKSKSTIPSSSGLELSVTVERTGVWGTPGKFKAIYRVFWEPGPPPPPALPELTVRVVQPANLPPALGRLVALRVEATDALTGATVPGATIVIHNASGTSPAPFPAGVATSVILRSRRTVDPLTHQAEIVYPSCLASAPGYADADVDLGFA